MNAKPQHASARVTVPAGFSGWWCERCEKAVQLPDELGSPARCPKCHKPTAVWVPPSAPVEDPRKPVEYHRTMPTRDQAKGLFEQMREAVRLPDPHPDPLPSDGRGNSDGTCVDSGGGAERSTDYDEWTR